MEHQRQGDSLGGGYNDDIFHSNNIVHEYMYLWSIVHLVVSLYAGASFINKIHWGYGKDKKLHPWFSVGYNHSSTPSFNVGKVRTWMSNYIPPFNMDVIIDPCPNLKAGLANLCESKRSLLSTLLTFVILLIKFRTNQVIENMLIVEDKTLFITELAYVS